MKTIRAFEVVIAVLVTICLSVTGWALNSLVAHEKEATGEESRATARIESLERDTADLKKGPTRAEWDTLKDDIHDMNAKLDRLLTGTRK